MASLTDAFSPIWGLAAGELKGIEIAQTDPENPNIGTYGWRSIGVPTITIGANEWGGIYLTAVNADANRANAEVRWIAQAKSEASPAYRSGALVRGSGAAASEAGYVAYINRSAGTLVVGKLVAGAFTSLATAAITLPASEEDYYCLFRVNGTSLKLKAWRYDAPEPSAWAIETTDSTHSAAGYVGLAFQCLTANNAGFHVPGFVAVGTNGESAPWPRSDIEIRRWVNDESNQRVILVKIGVLGQLANGTANPSQLLVSNWPFVTRGSDDPPDQVFDDIIVQAPTLLARANEQLLGRSTLAIGELVIASENGVRDHLLRWNWDGRPVEQYLGGVGWRLWDFIRVMTGTVASVYAPRRGLIGFKLRDMGAVLDKKLQTAVMGGSEADAGSVQPYALGKLFNIEPVLKASGTRRWKFHSGSLSGATGITAVRDKGSSAAYTADLANGELTLTTDNVGRVTIDINNDLAATSAGNTHRKAIRTIIEDQAGLGAEACYLGARSGSLANFATTATIGFYARREINVRDALDEVAISAGGFWYPNALGLFCAAQLRIPTAPYDHILLEDDLEDDIEIEDIWLPAEAEQLGYQRNWTPQDPDGLASGVSVANRALYGADAQYTAIAPSYSGLDQPANHLLRRRLNNRKTLFYNKADAETEAARLDSIFSKTCAIVRFTSRFNGPFFDLGESLHLTHSQFGFSEGRAGVIVGFEKKWRNASATLWLFVQLPGLFPITTVAAPHPPAEEIY